MNDKDRSRSGWREPLVWLVFGIPAIAVVALVWMVFIAAGPGKLRDNGERITLAVKVGDEVLYGNYAGSDVEVAGKDYKILRESEILAKISK